MGLAGLRVTAVSTIAQATVGILIGVTNRGCLFTHGRDRRIIAEVFAGIIAVVVIALVIDLILLLLGRALRPWTRAASKPAAATTRAAVTDPAATRRSAAIAMATAAPNGIIAATAVKAPSRTGWGTPAKW